MSTRRTIPFAPQRIRRPGRCTRVGSIHRAGARESRVRRVLEHTIDINATPEQVWEALTGFEAYEGWNPFMRRVAGAARGREQAPDRARAAARAPDRGLALGGRRRSRRVSCAGAALCRSGSSRASTPSSSRLPKQARRVVHRGWYRGLLVRLLGKVIDRTGHRVRAHAQRAQGAGRGAVAAGDRRAARSWAHRARDPRLRGPRLDAPHRGRARRRVGARRRAGRRARPGTRRRDARAARGRRLACRAASAGCGPPRATAPPPGTPCFTPSRS